jgi:hypothetical protein
MEEMPEGVPIVVTSAGLASAGPSQLNQWDLASSAPIDRKILISRGDAFKHHRKLKGAST